MSISGAIASSSTGRGPRGSISVVSYRRPSQARNPSDISSAGGKGADEKKKDHKDGQGSSGTKGKSFCVLLVAMTIALCTTVMVTICDRTDLLYGDGG